MTDARAITLAAETMGAPSPAARSVRLAVEALMSNPLPVTVTPQAGHLRLTGYPPVNRAVYPFTGNLVFTGHIPLITGLPPAPYTRTFCLDVSPTDTPVSTPQTGWNPAPEPPPE